MKSTAIIQIFLQRIVPSKWLDYDLSIDLMQPTPRSLCWATDNLVQNEDIKSLPHLTHAVCQHHERDQDDDYLALESVNQALSGVTELIVDLEQRFEDTRLLLVSHGDVSGMPQ